MTKTGRLVLRVLRADRARIDVLEGARRTVGDVGRLSQACALDGNAWTLITAEGFLARAAAAERLTDLCRPN